MKVERERGGEVEKESALYISLSYYYYYCSVCIGVINRGRKIESERILLLLFFFLPVHILTEPNRRTCRVTPTKKKNNLKF